MTDEAFFSCNECGSNVLAVSHTWAEHHKYEEVSVANSDGSFSFDEKVELSHLDDGHEWIAYCGGCGDGVIVEWLSEEKIRLITHGNSTAATSES